MNRSTLLAVACAIFAFHAAPASAADMTHDEASARCKSGNAGPITPYGETPKEASAKRVAFEWNCMVFVDTDVRGAFEKYVSKSYCNHGHISTRGARECSGYEETIQRWEKNYGQPWKPGEKREIPTMSSVNGEMVTMYGRGVDIFRVVDGKLTDHWDASPPAEILIPGHDPKMVQKMVQEVNENVAKSAK